MPTMNEINDTLKVEEKKPEKNVKEIQNSDE